MWKTAAVWFVVAATALSATQPVCAEVDEKPKKYNAGIHHPDGKHEEKTFDMSKDAHRTELAKLVEDGHVLHLEVEKPINLLDIRWDLGLWTLVVFIGLLLILRKAAWGPMLEGLQKREATIQAAVDEAKLARAETEKVRAKFKADMDEAYAEIPKIMEEARRDAAVLREETKAASQKDVQQERDRLRREIETAKDQALQELWDQAAQLATLISAKAIGRSISEDDHRRLVDEALSELQQAATQQ